MDISILLQDAFFAAIAAIGFASISNPPRRAFLYCAIIAAVGHSARYLMLNNEAMPFHIIIAGTIAGFIVGTLAVLLAPLSKCPAETCLFPALLPMIPGVYAYKCVGALMLFLYRGSDPAMFDHYYYLFTFNGLTCLFIVLGMVIGANIPIFLFKRISFQATR
jgi:uncharacterized membrane protein YjjB (DUF3815 family)